MSNNETERDFHDVDDGFSNHFGPQTRPQVDHLSPEIPGFRRTAGPSNGGVATVVFESIGATVVFESIGAIKSVYGDVEGYEY